MNPILLKPTSNVGSQVIVNGQVRGNMRAMEYYRRKREFVPEVMESYHSLAAEYDIIVIEGAGSPAEINLKDEDIVMVTIADGVIKSVEKPEVVSETTISSYATGYDTGINFSKILAAAKYQVGKIPGGTYSGHHITVEKETPCCF